MTAPITALLLPGLGDSGPTHWQSHWQRRDPTCQRVAQTEWDAPRREDWVACLDAALLSVTDPVVLVAHGAACAVVVHWAVGSRPARHLKVRAALLVAPSDPEGPHFPPGPTGFAPVPAVRLPFPSLVVASDNDPYVSLERARRYADTWGSGLEVRRGAGHLSADAGCGPWPEGWALLETLRALPNPNDSMPPWLADDVSFDAFLAAFEACTFPIAWWTHGAHVAMAAAILWRLPMPQALEHVRGRIRHYNLSQGGQNTDSTGYHETLTRLWMGAVAAALASLPASCTRLNAARRAYAAFARRSTLFLDWYDRELLKHVEARRHWVAPDPTLAGTAGDFFALGG